MADRPILFSAPMVRALLAGTKTQTRRLMPDQSLFREGADGPEIWTGFMGWQPIAWALANRGACGKGVLPRFLVGDRLYVREAWRTWAQYDSVAPRNFTPGTHLAYEATENPNLGDNVGKFRQGMHMPRWASRLTLIVTDVRVQRLQEISEADAIAEGLEHDIDSDVDGHGRWITVESWRGSDDLPWDRDPIEAYADLWDQLNDTRGYGWDTNPWVAAYTFEVKHGNIDQIGGAS